MSVYDVLNKAEEYKNRRLVNAKQRIELPYTEQKIEADLAQSKSATAVNNANVETENQIRQFKVGLMEAQEKEADYNLKEKMREEPYRIAASEVQKVLHESILDLHKTDPKKLDSYVLAQYELTKSQATAATLKLQTERELQSYEYLYELYINPNGGLSAVNEHIQEINKNYIKITGEPLTMSESVTKKEMTSILSKRKSLINTIDYYQRLDVAEASRGSVNALDLAKYGLQVEDQNIQVRKEVRDAIASPLQVFGAKIDTEGHISNKPGMQYFQSSAEDLLMKIKQANPNYDYRQFATDLVNRFVAVPLDAPGISFTGPDNEVMVPVGAKDTIVTQIIKELEKRKFKSYEEQQLYLNS